MTLLFDPFEPLLLVYTCIVQHRIETETQYAGTRLYPTTPISQSFIEPGCVSESSTFLCSTEDPVDQ